MGRWIVSMPLLCGCKYGIYLPIGYLLRPGKKVGAVLGTVCDVMIVEGGVRKTDM